MFVSNEVSVSDSHNQGVEAHTIERTILPSLYFIVNVVSHPGDEVGTNLGTIENLEVSLNVSNTQPTCVHCDDFIIEPGRRVWCFGTI